MLTKELLAKWPGAVRLSDGTVLHPSKYTLEKKWDGDFMKATLTNNTDKPLKIMETVLMRGNLPLSPTCPFYADGFQMLMQYDGTLAAPKVVGAYGTDQEFFRIPKTVFNKDLYTVYNYLLLSPTQKTRFLLSFTSSFKYAGEFRFKNTYLEIVMDCENIELEPGETWTFDEFGYFADGTREELFARLADRLNLNHPPIRYPEIPFGWCSYHCIGGVRADEMYREAQAMKDRIPELKRIQIDAGYQSSSDWLIPNPRTGADMKEICEKIRGIGVEPAGYFSPFLVNNDSVLFRDHPDWVVCDENGKPFNEITHTDRWYMLDGSNPDAVAYIRHVARTMHDEWGLRYFKLDFTSYGALPGGKRHNKMTRIESFRALFGAITEEVGADSYVLGCNAPFWPQLGLVHGNRATNDVFRSWKKVGGNAHELFYRNWQNGRLWINDPDGVCLEKIDRSDFRDGKFRRRLCDLSDAEINFHKAYIVASGGVVTSGDILSEISDKNIDILKIMMEVAGDAAVFEDDSFTVGRIDKGSYELVCVFNWNGEEMNSFDISLDGTAKITDLFTGRSHGTHTDNYTLFNLYPHDARVLKIEKV